jgi:glycosyltransferase involved in cell wall biosynthesis
VVRVWALEPYYGGSHRHFLDGLVRHSAHDFEPLTLPGRHWKWRMHGGALDLAVQADRLAEQNGRLPDVFFASDMLDLPVFLATLGRSAGPGGRCGASPGRTGAGAGAERGSAACRIPSIVYFHENQLTYPLPPGVERDLGYGFKNLTTALAAAKVLFNSEYHRCEFLQAAGALIAGMPDALPGWAVEEVAAKSAVLPLGCDLRALDEFRTRGLAEAAAGRWGDPGAGPLIVWNQRWEYDKAPEELFQALQTLAHRGVAFRLAVAGSGATVMPEAFVQARDSLAERVVNWDRLPDFADYASLLWAADVVVSTAIHEFFGIAVIEAIYCGCRPVLPRRLSYPELIPAEAHEEVLYGEGDLVDTLTRALAAPADWPEDWQRTWVARFDWGIVKTRYDDIIASVRARGTETIRGDHDG